MKRIELSKDRTGMKPNETSYNL